MCLRVCVCACVCVCLCCIVCGVLFVLHVSMCLSMCFRLFLCVFISLRWCDFIMFLLCVRCIFMLAHIYSCICGGVLLVYCCCYYVYHCFRIVFIAFSSDSHGIRRFCMELVLMLYVFRCILLGIRMGFALICYVFRMEFALIFPCVSMHPRWNH